MTYAPASDLLIPGDPNMGIGGCKLTCRNCIHFQNRPVTKIDGVATVCASPRIGRKPESKPCIRFSANSLDVLTDTPKPMLRRMLAVLSDIRSSVKYKNRNEQWAQAMIAYLGAYAYSVHKGLPLGGHVTVEGSSTCGKLLFLDKTSAVVLTDEDVRVTVEASTVRLAEAPQEPAEKKAKPRSKAQAGSKSKGAKAPKASTKKAADKPKKPAAKKTASKKSKTTAAPKKPAKAKTHARKPKRGGE